MESKKSFTGHSRRRITRFSVRLGEFLSRWIITIGGIGTIGAVVLVCVFLVYVAAPLFQSTKVTIGNTVPVTSPDARLLRFGVDEYQVLSWALFADGTLQIVRADTGEELERRRLFDDDDEKLTTCSPPGKTTDIAFGFDNGKVRVGYIRFKTSFFKDEEVEAERRHLPQGEMATYKGGIMTRGPDGQLRVQQIEVEPGDYVKVANKSPIVQVDLTLRSEADDSIAALTFLTKDGQLFTGKGKKSLSQTTGNLYLKLDSQGQFDLSKQVAPTPPSHVLVNGVGDNVFVAWDDGHCLRIGTQDVESPTIVEDFNLVADKGVTLTALDFLIGKSTLLAGDSSGNLRAWFRVKQSGAVTSDGNVMVMAHDLGSLGSPVTSLAVSSRSRMAVAGCANGRFRLVYITSEKQLAELSSPGDQAIKGLLIAPKDDAILVRTQKDILTCKIDRNHHHPEVTLSSIFLPVWYEGYEKPSNTWQATGGDDDYEPKLGFWPLIFGTLKATFYSLLIGVPLALLAALYTSEFLHPRAKAVVKPTVEMMASLPSVVLGFLAAFALAPFVDRWLAAVIAGLFTIPAAFALGAYVWQLLPDKIGLMLSRYRFTFICLVLPAGILAAALVGPLLENLLFQGDVKAWINGAAGTSGTPGWLILLLPLALITTLVLLAQVVNPWLRHRVMDLSRLQHALIDLGKFIAAAVFTLGLAYFGAVFLTACKFDPRGTFVGTYEPRNALVVGFMMGFAIIPIIFTIAEDALSAVPEHLRSASLGCGATPWQTATRIIVPTAMSGLFSAVMVGLGRAVGETMIVLMAAGGTPIMDVNIFNGFRTLSANIATEMPDAVVNSTHYRTLFLAALVLFAMTFVLNTIAEVIRQRFRKRAYQL